MKVRFPGVLLLLSVLLLCRGAEVGRADADDFRTCPDGKAAHHIEGHPATICVDYDKDKACAGMHGGQLRLKIFSPFDEPLEVTEPPKMKDKEAEQVITFRDGSTQGQDKSGIHVSNYTCYFDVSSDAAARPYLINLLLRNSKANKSVEYIFRFNACDNGGVTIDDTRRQPETASTNETKTIGLSLRNNSEYPVTVRRIVITSTPADLVRRVELDLAKENRPLLISNRKQAAKLDDLQFKVREMWARDWVYGFDSNAKLNFHFIYTDEDGRTLNADDELKLTVQPSVTALVIAILLGVLAGVWVKTDLQHLQREGYITARQKAMFVVGTVVVGLIASVVAILGEVEVSVFKFSSSSSSPKLLFLIGFAATMAGPQLLRRLFGKKDAPAKPAEGEGEQ